MSAEWSPTICAADVVPVEVSWLWEAIGPSAFFPLPEGMRML